MARSSTETLRPASPVDGPLVATWKESIEDPQVRRQLAKLLIRVPAFSESTEQFRLALCQVLVPMEFQTGQVVFRQGDTGTWGGLLLRGRLERRLLWDQRTGELKRAGEVGPGGLLGELCLFGVTDVRTATAIATEPTTLLRLERAAFRDLVASAGGPVEQAILADADKMHGLTSNVNAFQHLGCFKRLEPDFVMEVCSRLDPRLIFPNLPLMKENTYGHEMYILHEGEVKVEKGGRLVVKLGGGVVLGELAVLGSDKRRTATVTTTRLCLVHVVYGDVFHAMLNKYPRSKLVFDHDFIAKLCNLELAKVQDEVASLNTFYGRAHPMTRAQVTELVYGPQDEDVRASASRTAPPQRTPGRRGVGGLQALRYSGAQIITPRPALAAATA